MNPKDEAELWRKVNETHDIVLRLETKFGEGPGTWPQCASGKSNWLDHEARLRSVERRVNMVIGVIAFIAVLGAVSEIFVALHDSKFNNLITHGP
jgi:hypothetical protein